MKKKILSICLVVALLATGLIGATLAYFTDTDAATNVFTVGNIKIDLKEDFVQKSQLKPGIDVNKDACITNTGTNNAWVWAEVLVPAALDDNDDNSPQAPGLGNSLHMNYPGMYAKEYAQNKDAAGKYYNADLSKLWIMQHNADGVSYGFAGTESIDGVVYNKFVKLYTEVLEPGDDTSIFIDKVYMDSKVTQCTDTKHSNCLVLADKVTHYTGGKWEIIVRAYGIQADGFKNVVDAWKAYDGVKPAVNDGVVTPITKHEETE